MRGMVGRERLGDLEEKDVRKLGGTQVIYGFPQMLRKLIEIPLGPRG
jgi:hypothetical protein